LSKERKVAVVGIADESLNQSEHTEDNALVDFTTVAANQESAKDSASRIES